MPWDASLPVVGETWSPGGIGGSTRAARALVVAVATTRLAGPAAPGTAVVPRRCGSPRPGGGCPTGSDGPAAGQLDGRAARRPGGGHGVGRRGRLRSERRRPAGDVLGARVQGRAVRRRLRRARGAAARGRDLLVGPRGASRRRCTTAHGRTSTAGRGRWGSGPPRRGCPLARRCSRGTSGHVALRTLDPSTSSLGTAMDYARGRSAPAAPGSAWPCWPPPVGCADVSPRTRPARRSARGRAARRPASR